MKKIYNFQNFLNKINESSNQDSYLLGKIDYTLLKPESTEEQILELCAKAQILGVKSVCVLPKMVKVAADALHDSEVLVCTVISFPEGTNTTEQKLSETKMVISDGADEVDMVLNFKMLKEHFEDGYDELVYDVKSLVDECHNHMNKDGEPVTLKVIVESGLLTDEETEESTHICLDAGADFIKTSTGMVIGAQLNKIQIMKKVIDFQGSDMKIKASGGIKTMVDLMKFEPYVDRFGVGYAAVDTIFANEAETEDIY